MTFEITSSGKSVRRQLLTDIDKIEEPQKWGGSLGIKVAFTFLCRKLASCPQPGSWGILCFPVTLHKIFSFFLPLLQTVYTSSRLYLPKRDWCLVSTSREPALPPSELLTIINLCKRSLGLTLMKCYLCSQDLWEAVTASLGNSDHSFLSSQKQSQ